MQQLEQTQRITHQVQAPPAQTKVQEAQQQGSKDFGSILDDIKEKQDKNNVKISAHAADRLKERNITLNQGDMDNLNSAVQKLKDKGGREALIIYKDTAFLTSIRNNTVITAIDNKSMKDNVFTNIDSALFI